MGFFEKIGLVEAAEPPVQEPEAVEEAAPVEMNVESGEFAFNPENVVSAVKQQLEDAGFPLQSLQQFNKYTATLPDTMSDDAKAKTLSSILTVSGVSMVNVADDIAAYENGLVSMSSILVKDCDTRVNDATREIAEHKKAIEELQNKIEATQSYRLTATAAIDAERKSLDAVSAFALLVSNNGGSENDNN